MVGDGTGILQVECVFSPYRIRHFARARNLGIRDYVLLHEPAGDVHPHLRVGLGDKFYEVHWAFFRCANVQALPRIGFLNSSPAYTFENTFSAPHSQCPSENSPFGGAMIQ